MSGRTWTSDRIRWRRGDKTSRIRSVRVKRRCNGCGRTLGDATSQEFSAAIYGAPLPDTTRECGCVKTPAADIPRQPVDAETAQLLTSLAEDPARAEHRAAIIAAINADAVAHGGKVDPNRVRNALRSGRRLAVPSRMVGGVYGGLVHAGHLVADGWTTSTDNVSRNAGKPVRLYRMATPGGAR